MRNTGPMIGLSRAQQLQAAGLRWEPASGDRFTLRASELVGQVFTVADMVVEARRHHSGTVLAFNGTTEWALDSAAVEEALWLPLEHQLRALLGGAFAGLAPVADGFEVRLALPGAAPLGYIAADAGDAYADALLALIAATR